MADEDPYFVLGLDPRADLTDGEIKKAYRKKALVLHPDKRKDSEREVAQREFDALQKAYDILLDPAARKALEDLAKARAATRARFDAQDLKRRKLREDLERRERVAAVGKTEEEEAQERLQKELVRLRRDFAVRKKGFDNGRLGGGRGMKDVVPVTVLMEIPRRRKKMKNIKQKPKTYPPPSLSTYSEP
ncbi:J domain-containing protein [bacterium]|nr:J domain-containing protein [bacterium]